MPIAMMQVLAGSCYLTSDQVSQALASFHTRVEQVLLHMLLFTSLPAAMTQAMHLLKPPPCHVLLPHA